MSSVLLVALPMKAVAPRSSAWAGLEGEELKRAVASASTPQTYHTVMLGENGVWSLLRKSDANESNTGYLNRFGNESLEFPVSPDLPPAAATLVPLLPNVWWKSVAPGYEAAKVDLYNFWPGLLNVLKLKGSYGPGTVDTPEYDNGTWSVGTWFFADGVRHAGQPPRGYEGDFARVMFYMLTVYPDGLEQTVGYGAPYVERSYYPGISDEAVRQLLVWHRADAVDERELRRNDLIETVQGNRNPFVDTPALVEFLWGSEKGSGFDPSAETGGDSETDTSPLRASYRLSDSRINLSSPFVPSDAEWSVDGKAVEGDYLLPSVLGTGMHELCYRKGDKVGKLLIEIIK